MGEDVLYERGRRTDRETAAATLRKLADRLAAGDQLLPTDSGDGPALCAPETVALNLRATDGDAVHVSLDMRWAHEDDRRESSVRASGEGRPARTEGERSDPSEGAAHEDDRAAAGSEDPHESTGWASAGASEGYALPRLDSLDDADDEFERAAYFLRKGKTEAALGRFESAIEATPEDARRQYHVATVHWTAGDPGTAATHFERAASLAPEDVPIRLEYASFCWSQGRLDQAREHYEHALDTAPDDPDVHSALGRFRWETDQDVAAAAEHLTTALDIDADHGLAHLNYAVLLRHGGKHDRAETHFQQALSLRGDDPVVQREYGHFCWARGDIEDAARHYANAE